MPNNNNLLYIIIAALIVMLVMNYFNNSSLNKLKDIVNVSINRIDDVQDNIEKAQQSTRKIDSLTQLVVSYTNDSRKRSEIVDLQMRLNNSTFDKERKLIQSRIDSLKKELPKGSEGFHEPIPDLTNE